MNVVISFIIPFYNVEKYIADCLNSIYNQGISEDDYEVICIDDCSPDNSIEIVKQFQNSHSNLRLIEHDVNKGLGGARNTGILHAKGEYIWFVDSDDMIETINISLTYNILKLEPIEVLMFNFERINSNGSFLKEEIVFDNSMVFKGLDYVNTYFRNSFIYHLGYVWRCIYKREYLIKSNLYFPEKSYWEDTVFFPKAILMADSVMSMKNVLYKYRINNESISGNNNKFNAIRYFQFAFIAGSDLYNFANEYKNIDPILANQFSLKAIGYFNSFTKPLLLSSYTEKIRFYKLLKINNELITKLQQEFKFKNKILIIPLFGFLLSNTVGILYKLKRYLK